MDKILEAGGAAHVIWDWNGTLLDDTQAALDTLNIMRNSLTDGSHSPFSKVPSLMPFNT